MSIKVMKQALEALEEFNEVSKGVDAVCLPGEIDTAMDALRQAIEQAEQAQPPVLTGIDCLCGKKWRIVNNTLTVSEPQTVMAEYKFQPYAAYKKDGEMQIGVVPEPEREGTVMADYERGFVDGMSEQTKRSVDKAVNRMAEPEQAEQQEPVAIKWTLDGEKNCGYNNWLGETPFGRILITWKNWKEPINACVDDFPGGFFAYGNVDEVKAECEAEFLRRLGAAPPQRKPLTDEEIALIVGECAASAYRHDDFSFARAIEAAHGITREGA